MPNRPNLRTAIITGASSGIGRELVRQLAGHPDLTEVQIIATARRLDRLQSLADEFPEGRVLTFVADLTLLDHREGLIRFARERFETLDLLVNNAGMGAYSLFEETDSVAVRRIISLDLEAVIDLTAQAIRWMKPVGSGQIVQISSILGEVGMPYSAVYTAAKHAVDGLVKSVRPELHGSGVSVWAACPGRTVSEFRKVAGGPRKSSQGRGTESTEKVAKGIVRGIVFGHSRPLLYPTWQPWLISWGAWICPRIWELMMIRFRGSIASESLGDSVAAESVKHC